MTQSQTRHPDGAAAPRPSMDSPAFSRAGQRRVMISRVLWLVRLRWFAAGAIVALWAVLWWGRSFGELYGSPWPWLWCFGALLAAHNGFIRFTLRRCEARDPAAAERFLTRATNDTIVIDLLAWLGVMHFTGGVMSPLVAVLVFELAVAVSLLPRRHAYLQAAGAGALYVALLLAETVGRLNRPWTAIAGFAFPHQATGSFLPVVAVAAVLVVATFFLTVYLTDAILSRLRRINQRLVGANAQLSALDLTKSRFLRISSHQLRGPLAAIHSMLSAIQEVGGLNPKQFELIGRILARSEEVMSQLDEMMLLSTVQERTVETTRSGPVEVSKVLTDAAAGFAEEAREKGLELKVDADGPVTVSAWEDALDTVLAHLLGNAIKYTPRGGRVSLSAAVRGRFVEIAVADSGIGIPREQQEQVFREFFRATNARQVGGGTGLGLSIVKAIVERLGGLISLDSAEGRGTTVTVSLPIEQNDQSSKIEIRSGKEQMDQGEDRGLKLAARHRA